MEVSLVIVTLLSLALAIGMAIVTWRLLQEERERADARVAALEEGLAASLAAPAPASTPASTESAPVLRQPALFRAAAAAETAEAAKPGEAESAKAEAEADTAEMVASSATRASEVDTAKILVRDGTSRVRDDAYVAQERAASVGGEAKAERAEIFELQGADDPDWLSQFPASSAQVNGLAHANGSSFNGAIRHANGVSIERASDASDVGVAGSSDAVATGSSDAFAAERLFTEAEAVTRTSRRSRSVLAIGVGGAVIVLLIVGFWSVGHLHAPGMDSRAPIAGASGARAATATPGAPLELVSLEQAREGDTLTIHGVVRNPPAGVMIDRLAVVVAFFDGAGQQLSSVRAPLDFRTLAPGDESPFQVTTPVPAGVTRYRVSFRRDEGTIVPHVDRRQQEAS